MPQFALVAAMPLGVLAVLGALIGFRRRIRRHRPRPSGKAVPVPAQGDRAVTVLPGAPLPPAPIPPTRPAPSTPENPAAHSGPGDGQAPDELPAVQLPATETPNAELPKPEPAKPEPAKVKLPTAVLPTAVLPKPTFPTAELSKPTFPTAELRTDGPAKPDSPTAEPAKATFPTAELPKPAFPKAELPTAALPTPGAGLPAAAGPGTGAPAGAGRPPARAPKGPKAAHRAALEGLRDLTFTGLTGTPAVDIDFSPEVPTLPEPATPTLSEIPGPARRPPALAGPGLRGRPPVLAPATPEPGTDPIAPTPPVQNAPVARATVEEPPDSVERAPVEEPAAPVEQAPATPAPRRRGATKRQQAMLATLPEKLAGVSGRQQVAAAAMAEAAELIGADATALVIRSIHGPRILWQHPAGVGEPELWGARTLAALLLRPDPVRLSLKGDPLAGGGRTALVTAPVPAAGASIGVVVARRRAGKAFTAADEDALDRLARITGARLHRTVERAAVAVSALDPATRLGGHDLLMSDLADALQAAPAHGMPTTLLVAEVAGLARLRTARGMAAADDAIGDVAARVGGGLRVGDLLYRLSADELAVLLPATDADQGVAVAERLAGALPSGELLPGLSLRPVAVPVEVSAEAVMLRVMRDLAAARVTERWSEAGR